MKTLIAVLAVLLLQGCGTVHNTMRDGEDGRVMLRGNDPVSYFSGAGPQKGDSAIKSVFEGDVYRFASDADKRLFDANPAQYAQASAEETKDMPYRLQNAKRLVFRVAHYKTDRELDAEHLRRFGKLPPGAPPPR